MSGVLPTPAESPTMYFIGVTTGSSAINSVFKAWAPLLGVQDAKLVGIDLPLDATQEAYRAVVRFIDEDPQSRGALVTTHKLRLFDANRDVFSRVNDDAQKLAEVSCLVSEPGGVAGLALDVVTSSLALRAITPSIVGRDVLLMGAGGAALALASYLSGLPSHAAPARVIVTDVRQSSLDALATLVDRDDASKWEFELVNPSDSHDGLLATCRPGALIVNATGKGKDRPGSPLTDEAIFPQGALCWDFNYRGSLEFLAHARLQAEARELDIHDGWVYFVHGWTRAIAEVFSLDIPTEGPLFDRIASAARAVR